MGFQARNGRFIAYAPVTGLVQRRDVNWRDGNRVLSIVCSYATAEYGTADSALLFRSPFLSQAEIQLLLNNRTPLEPFEHQPRQVRLLDAPENQEAFHLSFAESGL